MELSEIILTPITSGSTSYRVTWTPSYYNTSRYMITVYPPESYTQEDLIIHNTDNSTVHNITVALNDCPHKTLYYEASIKSILCNLKMYVIEFLICCFSGCNLIHFSGVTEYRIALTSKMFAHVTGYNDLIS